jgi:hypothetical protein
MVLDSRSRRENDADMISVPLTVRFFVATGTAAVLVGCSSSGGSTDSADSEPTVTQSPASPTPSGDSERQAYLDAVNALCDALLPKVVEATHGGSIDVPAEEWVQTWPAHKALLDGFDADLAKITEPPSAADAAQVLADYIVWATGVDTRRIAAAREGEAAWRAEVDAEADITDDPKLLALGPAGFNDSCQAR